MDSQPGFDVAALDEWIGDRLPGRGPQAQTRAAMVDRLIRYAGLFAREERAAAREVAR